MIIAGILGLILFCAAVIVISIYRKWKIELEIEGLLWKIEPQEICGYFGNDIVASPSKVRMVYYFSGKCGRNAYLGGKLIDSPLPFLPVESGQCRLLRLEVLESSVHVYRQIPRCDGAH